MSVLLGESKTQIAISVVDRDQGVPQLVGTIRISSRGIDVGSQTRRDSPKMRALTRHWPWHEINVGGLNDAPSASR